MLTQETIADYQRRFGLTYHVPYALEAESAIGLRGKAVLEVGGSLPAKFVGEGLGARQWVAVEEMAYWHEVRASGGTQGTPPAQTAARQLADARPDDLGAPYQLFSGGVEDLPAALHGRFDAAFSIAAFEHIARLPLALAGIHAALKPGGRLFTMFSPIWSGYNGHHLPDIRDPAGRKFSFAKSPIPPWAHLLLAPEELRDYLEAETDAATATEMLYYVFESPHINRLFAEDYAGLCRASAFQVERCEPTFAVDVPPPLQSELERRYPGRSQFGNTGMLIVLRKEA